MELDIEDPRLASEHFTFLVIGPALFTGTDEPPSADEIDARALKGVEVFLRAYRTGVVQRLDNRDCVNGRPLTRGSPHPRSKPILPACLWPAYLMHR